MLVISGRKDIKICFVDITSAFNYTLLVIRDCLNRKMKMRIFDQTLSRKAVIQ